MFENTYKSINEKLNPSPELISETLEQMEAGENVSLFKRRKRTAIAALALALVLALSFGAIAMPSLLSPKDAARYVSYHDAVIAFSQNNLIQSEETAVVGDYIVTLSALGTRADRTYIMLVYQRTDGAPIDEQHELTYDMGRDVLISGLPPDVLNQNPLHITHAFTVMDGVAYEVFDCPNLEIFADRTVYLAVYDTVFLTEDYPVAKCEDPSNNKIYARSDECLTMNPDGSIEFFEDFPNTHALFVLPFDKSKADPERSQKYLDSLESYQNWVAQTGYYDPKSHTVFHSFQEVRDFWEKYLTLG